MNKTIFFHIGYPKTASTSLQRNVFSKLQSIDYLGKRYENGIVEFEGYVNEFYYGASPAAEFKLISGARDILVSDEGVTAFHKINKDYCPVHPIKQMKMYADSQGLTLKVILTYRSILELVPSSYAQGYGDIYKFDKNLDTYEKYVRFLKDNYTKSRIENLLSPEKYIARIAKIVGKNNLFVSHFSLLKNDEELYLANLKQFLNVKEKFPPIGRENVKKIRGNYYSIDYGVFAGLILKSKFRFGFIFKFGAIVFSPIKPWLLNKVFSRKRMRKIESLRIEPELERFMMELDRDTTEYLKNSTYELGSP